MKTVKISVGQKAAICIGMVFIILVAVLYICSNTVIKKGFADLEHQSVETNIIRLHNSIYRELENLETIDGDWAPWDDSRDFVLGKSPDYIASNLTEECIKNLKLDFMVFFDVQGKIVHCCFIDPQGTLTDKLPEDVTKALLLEKQFFEIKDPAQAKSGMIVVSDSPILVAVQPISNSATELPIAGTLIIGRYLNDAVVEKLKNQTCLNFKIINDLKDPSIVSKTKNYIEIINDKLITGYTNFYEIGTDRCVTFQLDMPRDISNYGKKVIACFVFVTAIGGLFALCILLHMLRILILNPLNILKNNFEEIDKDSTLSTKLYTDRKDEIGSLARSFDTLMNHLKERMVELSEKQSTANSLNLELIQTTEKLKEANSELKNFVYVASHDLREPLRKITVFAEMLKNSLANKIEGDDVENLNYMVDGAERMKKMIDGLLLYSRVSTQPHPLQKVDLNTIVEQVCKFELAVLIDENNAIINKPQPLPTIVGDNTQITQLMQNLIANGIKYQKHGNRPQITITSKPAPDGNVRIEVADNGIGIKPEYHGAVFTMFKRLHSKEYEGTGIGLSVCKKIVERHNGKIGVESQPDQGSTFWFTMAEVHAKAAVSVPKY